MGYQALVKETTMLILTTPEFANLMTGIAQVIGFTIVLGVPFGMAIWQA